LVVIHQRPHLFDVCVIQNQLDGSFRIVKRTIELNEKTIIMILTKSMTVLKVVIIVALTLEITDASEYSTNHI